MTEAKVIEFSVNDYIVHPEHGAGQITGTEHLALVEGFEHYYIIEFEKQD